MRRLRELVAFWREVLWNTKSDFRIIVFKSVEDKGYREFYPKQTHFRVAVITLCLIYTLTVIGLTIFAFSNGLVPGLNLNEFRQGVVLTSAQLQTLSDSLNMQEQYLETLQRIMVGHNDSILVDTTVQVSRPSALQTHQPVYRHSQMEQQIYPISWTLIGKSSPSPLMDDLESLQLPVLPPVQGLITQGLNHDERHYAIDIAIKRGSIVRSIGDGYVIVSDWTYKGGHTIAIQHADGYVSVYKHNQRLLKRVGDRVSARESIAVAGDSGKYTSGPHLHFELWKNGVAQAPANYLLGY